MSKLVAFFLHCFSLFFSPSLLSELNNPVWKKDSLLLGTPAARDIRRYAVTESHLQA